MASPIKTLHVDVTAEDIEKGEKQDGTSCAIARALRRTYPRRDWHVTFFDVEYTTKGGRCNVYVADDLSLMGEFISAFDNGRPVEPISLDLSLYDSYIA